MSNTEQPIRILHLEDDPDDAELVRHAIKKSGIKALWINVPGEKDFVAALQNGTLSLILADASLPGFDGNAALKCAREKCPGVPFVFVSGQMQEDAAIEALRSGATDYVFKSSLQRLGPVVRRALDEAQARRAQQEYAQVLARLQDCASGASGQEYFEQLLRTLADVLQVRHAFIGVVTSPATTRVRTVAWWTGNGFAENLEYDLAGTPCAHVVARKECLFPDGVQARFPGDRMLGEMGIVSYHGIPLFRRDGSPLGLLSVFDTAPMDSRSHLRSLLGLFGGRAAMEIERLEVVERLHESNARLSTLLQSSPLAIYTRDRDGLITSWNPAAEQVYGWKAAEVIGKRLPTVSDALRAESDALRVRLLAGESFIKHETKRRKRDGTPIDVDAFFAPLRSSTGEITGIITLVSDITERKKTEAERMQLAAIVESSRDAIISMAMDRTVRTWNSGAERLFGYSAEDAISRNIAFMFPEHRLHELGGRRNAALAGQGLAPFNTERLTRDGRCVPVSVSSSPLRDNSGNVTGIALIYRDMTEQAIAESALRESEERLRATFEQAAVGMALRDLDPRNPRWLRVNQKLCDIFGYTRDEMLQLTSVDITHSEDRDDAIAYNKKLLNNEIQGYSREKRYLRKDGTVIWANLTLSAVQGADGRPTHAISVIEDISERKRNEERLLHLAHYDQLTSLPNRVLLQDRLQLAIAQAGRNGDNVAVLLLDLDRFKLVNDTLGHDAGDILLQQVTGRLQELLRSGDTVARLGGDEFIVILSSLRSPEDASVVAQKMLDRLAQPFAISNQQVFVSASIGITLYPADSDNVTALIKNADAAMYHAKELGRNAYHFFTPELNARSRRRIELEAALRKAAANSEFSLHYQPRVNLATGRVQGVEALLRWDRPGHDTVSPGEFVPVLEDTGLILPVSEQLFETACRQLRRWHDSGLHFLTMAVNLSARQFQSDDIAETFRRIAASAGVDLKSFEFEITESLLVHSPEQAAAILQRLKDSGATVAIDDFGTGYSSLSYLTSFPIDCVKIDRSFVENIVTNPSSAAVALAVIDMAHRLGLRTVAEGVETEAQLRYLAANECDEMQGFYFSRPLPAAECTTLLEANTGLTRHALGRESRDSCLLLIDDEPDDLAALERTFKRENYRILTATNAGDALQLLASHRVGVVICDQRMPGIAGTELLSRIRQMHPQTVRMALSGHSDLNAVLDAINVGAASKFLTKPWDDEQLRELVKEAFRLFELGAGATRQA